MSSCFLSVIIPCFNAEEYLPSLFQQLETWHRKDIEILLINDGSVDATEALCGAYAKRDARVKVVSQPNGGAASARNAGLSVACGHYIFFMDCDDVVDWDSMNRIMETVKNRDVDIVVFGYKFQFIRENRVIRTESYKPSQIVDIQNVRYSILREVFGISLQDICDWHATGKLNQRKKLSSSCTHLYRRAFLTDSHIRFNTRLRMYEDGMFNCECALYASTIELNDEQPYTYLQRDKGAVHSFVDPEKIFSNKVALVHERERIAKLAAERDNVRIEHLSMGSEVLSLFQMASKVDASNVNQVERCLRQYASLNKVRTAISMMPKSGPMKFRVPLFLLKHKCYKILLLLILFAKRMGIPVR